MLGHERRDSDSGQGVVNDRSLRPLSLRAPRQRVRDFSRRAGQVSVPDGRYARHP